MQQGPIGVFDSGFGGMTVLKELIKKLPQYDFLYLGDNARAPYGTKPYETVYNYTLECVNHLFKMGCPLVILACNTASAKALRTIQQIDLPRIDPSRRVLGVIRPTSEVVGHYTQTGHIGVLGTPGTVGSGSYAIEIHKFFPDIRVFQEACPMWVPLIESNEMSGEGADYFIKSNIDNLLNQSSSIDTIILGCTHYPLIIDKIKRFLNNKITILSQGEIIADSLVNYLQRHPEMEMRCQKNGLRKFYTTDVPENFDIKASLFWGSTVKSENLKL